MIWVLASKQEEEAGAVGLLLLLPCPQRRERKEKQLSVVRAVQCQESWHFYLPSLLKTWYVKVVNKHYTGQMKVADLSQTALPPRQQCPLQHRAGSAAAQAGG